MTKRTRLWLMAAAAILLLAAGIWSYFLNNDTDVNSLVQAINRYGYTFTYEDFYIAGEWENTSVRALLLEDDLDEAIALSQEVGLKADIDERGAVTLLLAQTEDQKTVTLFYLDGFLELGFVQSGDALYPLGTQ